MAVQIQLRRGTASQWTSANPILAEGEMGVELDTGKWKFGNGTSTWSILAYGSGAALLDADKGDITVSGTGTVWTIDTGAVTYAKMQAASTTSRVLGASSTSTTIQELTLGTGLSLSGTTLSATGATVADADYGNITVSGTGTVWTIDAGVVTYAKMQAASTNSKVIGSSSTSTTLTELTLGTGLSLSGTTLTATGGVTDGDKGDITVSSSGASWVIDSGAVTYAKLQTASTNSKLLGTSSTSTTFAELTLGTGLSLSGTTLTATAVGLTDGDKGDITVSATGSSWVIDNQAVTYAKIQDVSATDKLLGRSTAGAGSVEEITCTAAGRAILDDADATAQRTTLGLGTLATQSGTFSGTSSGTNTGDQTITLTGDVTGSGTGSFAATIAAGAVSTSKLGGDITTAGKALLDDADAAAQRTTLGLGTLATQSGTFSGTSSGTNTGDQTISLTGDVTGSGTGSFAATIANSAVTNAKLANVSTSTIKGRVTAGSGDPEDLTGTQATTLLDVFTSSLKGLAPSSGGGTTNFLRADGTWAAPSGGGGGAPTTAEYLVKTADATLSAERVVGDSTSIVANWATSGQVSFERAALTGDVTASANANATTIANDAVTNAKLANMTASTIKARITASTGDPEDATLTQVLDLVGSAAQGDILYRGASSWTRLGAGTSGHYLKTLGTGANPEWATVSASGGGSTNVWIPASAWIPRTTTGCGVDSTETTTNRQNFDQLLFDAATNEFAQALVRMPSNYNNGTVTARFYWTASTGSGAVVWGLQGLAYADDGALDTASGTAQTVTDTLLATNDMHISASTSAITIGGTPAATTPIQFQVYRDAAAGGDTLGNDARLLGVEIIFTSA